MCGEHRELGVFPRTRVGSSPHVRGARHVFVFSFALCGIIPACAGSTPRFSRSVSLYRDHPRMCGEHLGSKRLKRFRQGSSPHVRGALWQTRHFADERGIIPACAGSTRRFQPWQSSLWDHPRMCGEHDIRRDKRVELVGSSPHVRGAPSARR